MEEPATLRTVLATLPLLRAIADTGGISAAADELGLPQSTVSRGIARLEHHLDTSLLERDGRGVRLTPAGHELATTARRTLEHVTETITHIRADTARRNNTVSVVFQNSLGRAVIPALVKALVTERPGTRVNLRQGGRAYCITEFTAGAADLVLVAPPMDPQPNTATASLYTEHLILAVPRTHPYATRKSLRLNELHNQPTLGLAPAYGLRDITDSLLSQAGVRITYAFEGEDVQTVRGLVAAGLGLAILPPEGNTPDLTEIPIDDPHATRELAASWRPADTTRPALAALTTILGSDPSWLPGPAH
ncbi:LysR family transcriptional regulator [Kineosporia rhizophila]|uniref:LysR family transcriptional regulator n=1 Tax=Kineosporia rhizophila TaxID=84633 RepID=UPI001E3C852E|nr:LysR family transcriptional regulator [Kineosporia rhizophila]MCE0539559.1 LysR family transcriptional regulator [Kineosporia rhizophila]